MRGAPPPPPPARFDSRGYYPEGEAAPPGYPPRGYPAPPPREYYDRYDRRTGPPPPERYGTYPAPAVRPRTPPGAPPARAAREEYDRPPARYVQLLLARMLYLNRSSSATIPPPPPPPPRPVAGPLLPLAMPTILPPALGVLNATGEFQPLMAVWRALIE